MSIEQGGSPFNSDPSTESKQDSIIQAIDRAYPAGTGSNDSVTLTSANTAYAVPASAPSSKYVLILYNGSDTDIYYGFQNSNANGILLPPDGKVAVNLGASQAMYAYCASAGKVITYSYKEVA